MSLTQGIFIENHSLMNFFEGGMGFVQVTIPGAGSSLKQAAATCRMKINYSSAP